MRQTMATVATRRAKHSKRKGARIEREIVAMHRDAGIRAVKVSRIYGPDEDILIDTPLYPKCPLVCEVKGRASAMGNWQKVADWLDGKHVLFLKADRHEPLVVLPWAVWVEIIGGKHE